MGRWIIISSPKRAQRCFGRGGRRAQDDAAWRLVRAVRRRRSGGARCTDRSAATGARLPRCTAPRNRLHVSSTRRRGTAPYISGMHARRRNDLHWNVAYERTSTRTTGRERGRARATCKLFCVTRTWLCMVTLVSVYLISCRLRGNTYPTTNLPAGPRIFGTCHFVYILYVVGYSLARRATGRNAWF